MMTMTITVTVTVTMTVTVTVTMTHTHSDTHTHTYIFILGYRPNAVDDFYTTKLFLCNSLPIMQDCIIYMYTHVYRRANGRTGGHRQTDRRRHRYINYSAVN